MTRANELYVITRANELYVITRAECIVSRFVGITERAVSFRQAQVYRTDRAEGERRHDLDLRRRLHGQPPVRARMAVPGRDGGPQVQRARRDPPDEANGRVHGRARHGRQGVHVSDRRRQQRRPAEVRHESQRQM